MAHVMPKAKPQDISSIIDKANATAQLSTAEICLLSDQTGLGEFTVREMLHSGHASELLSIYNIYFAPVTIEEYHTTPLTISEWLAEAPIPGYEGMPIVDIQDGDILITKNSRFLGWRNGHAGLVIDAEKGLVLEAIMLGSPSQLCKIEKWEKYPSFLVLRLKEEFLMTTEAAGIGENTVDGIVQVVPGNIAEKAASYASEHLVDIPYQLLAGVFSRRLYQTTRAETRAFANVATEPLTGTQCAHLVWYAYKQFGIDLDSDGGFFVTPYDIQNSPYLEVVQSYGY